MATAFKIDTDVPLPDNAGVGRKPRYPFASMQVGDSFTVPIGSATNARTAALGWGRRHGMAFTTRTTKDGMRIWRVA